MDWETGERLWRCSNVLACYVVAQFLFACWLAMALYPSGYELSQLFLSDLGTTKTHSGDVNGWSFWLFNGSLAALGLGTIPFYLFFWISVPDQPIAMWGGAIAGIVSSLALIGIAVTPYDQHRQLHEQALGIWIGGLVGVIVLHSIAIMRSRETSIWLTLPGVVVLACVGLYLMEGISMVARTLVRQQDTDSSAMNPMIAQKLVVTSVLVWYAVHSLAGIFRVREARPNFSRSKKIAASASEYAERITRRR